MTLLGSRLNSARYTSILADLQTQFPINAGLLSAEQADCATSQSKIAHALADHEGTDVVAEITTNAVVPSVTSTPAAQSGPSTLPGTATGTIT